MSSLGTNFNQTELRDNNEAVLHAKRFNVEHATTSLQQSGVSWAAVLAGSLAAAALSLIFILLGVGFGMSSVSVWSGQGVSASVIGFTAIFWLAFTQIIAYGMGGYLAGRLRVKWVSVHNDEVYFRDTAHGFLTWALATLLSATLLSAIISSMAGSAVSAGATLLGGATSTTIAGATGGLNMANNGNASQASINNPMQYTISALFRKENNKMDSNLNPAAAPNSTSSDIFNSNNAANQITEVASIFINNMNTETLPPSDVNYVGQLIAQHTGISQNDAEYKVVTTFKTMQEKKASAILSAKEAVEKARKTAANSALWFFAMLLIGAFSASLAATWGGKSRDN